MRKVVSTACFLGRNWQGWPLLSVTVVDGASLLDFSFFCVTCTGPVVCVGRGRRGEGEGRRREAGMGVSCVEVLVMVKLACVEAPDVRETVSGF